MTRTEAWTWIKKHKVALALGWVAKAALVLLVVAKFRDKRRP
jgi:hypothetical protein